MEICIDFLCECPTACINLNRNQAKNYKHTCNCLAIFREANNSNERAAIAEFLIDFFTKNAVDQKRRIIEWVRYSADIIGDRRFLVPAHIYYDQEPSEILPSHRICKDALGFLLDFGQHKWKEIKVGAQKNQVPRSKSHGAAGKGSNNRKNFLLNTEPHLRKFLQKVSIIHGSPQSTRVVREISGVGLRDGEENEIELAPFITKRGLYKEFCDEQGWIVKQFNGQYTIEQKSGENVHVNKNFSCSWGTFRNYWKSEFPTMKIRRSAKDVCDKCYVFNYQFNHLIKRQKRRSALKEDSSDDSNTSDEELESAVDTVINYRMKLRNKKTAATVSEDESDSSASSVVDEDDLAPSQLELEKEETIFDACQHVNQARGQRELCRNIITLAEEDATAKLSHSEASRCLVMDYSQNASLPQFADTQPGKTYYYSPVIVNIFGIVDTSIKGGELDCFVYHEGQGGKEEIMLHQC